MEMVEDSYSVVIVFGIVGNILVILSILRQKNNMLKNNYYFLVLHLAICDLVVLIIFLFNIVDLVVVWLKEPILDHPPMITCDVYVIGNAFQLAGVGMMLIISLLRYRATVHPVKPAISRRKLKVVCGLVYLVGLIAACGTRLPLCFIKSTVVSNVYGKFFNASQIFLIYFGPTIFMAAVYYKIGRSLMKQNKHMKRICSNVTRQRAPDSSFNILRYIRNRQTFLVCLSTVLCYGIACIAAAVWIMWIVVDTNYVHIKYVWFYHLSDVLKTLVPMH